MSEENKEQSVSSKEILEQIQKAKEVYALVSGYTRMPYVVCDEETYDDEILLFWDEESAKEAGKKLQEDGNAIVIVKVENKQLLSFFSGLFAIGANSVAICKGMEQEQHIQLDEIVKRPDGSQLPEGTVLIENPQMHLTALYLMQELRKQKEAQMTEELQELQEEMLVNFKEGRYIVAVEEGKGLPILKQKDGVSFQPIFTDILEFQKFNQERKFKTAVVEYEKIAGILAPEVKGVVVNPFGVNIPLQIERKRVENQDN